MNIVKQIMDQLSGDSLGQLTSLLGTDADTAERATSAAVPSLLSALAGMTSNDVTTKKLTNVLGGLDSGGLGNIAQMLGGDANSLLNKGTSMLASLFGDDMISNIAGAVSRFAGLDTGMVKKLLAYLSPLVLGKVAAHWKKQGGNSQALTKLFADQRSEIASAVPAGFSLADVPGLMDTKKSAYSSDRQMESKPAAAGSPVSWLLPLAVLLIGGFLLWQFLSRPKVDQAAVEQVTVEEATPMANEVVAMKPALPDTIDAPAIRDVRADLGGLFESLNTSFTDIQDAASAEAALPALRDLNSKIDNMNQDLARLPQTSVAGLRPVIEDQVNVVIEKANSVGNIEGIGAEIRALIQEIVAKITKWISPDNQGTR